MQPQVLTPPGTRRYRVERELGRGGMGVVYQAFDLERNTLVALKALTQSDALNIYRLKNEFRQLSDLSHPNLVALHELTFDGEQWFFTMELVDGVTFDRYVAPTDTTSHVAPREGRGMQATVSARMRLARDASVTLSQPASPSAPVLPRSPCDLTRLRSALAQLVAAIAALHDAGKLHRDIKPSNVLVTPEGRVVVLDFGLVSSSTRIEPDAQDPDRTIGGTVFGTPAYMSPEQAAGEPLSTASDWYSVGCIVYEALTGRLPFDGTVLQILKQKEEQEPPAPSEVASGIPEDLDQFCRALLRRRPEDRPSGDEIRRAFTGSSVPPPLRESLPENRSELFVGREPHLQVLRAAFERAKSGRTTIVFVHGYSGMGKSALVRCFANELIKGSEAVVLRGRCYERESVPYKAFDDIIDALSRYMMRLPADEAAELLPRNVHSLARLFPVLKRVRAVAHARVPLHQTDDPHEMRNQAFGALKELLLRLSDWQPVAINIDDLQWADTDSARLLSHLLGPPDPPPVLFVGVYRREEANTSPFLRHVLADPGLQACDPQQLAVDPLSADEATRLTKGLLHGHPLADAWFAESIAAESEGVPIFIGELARHLRTQTKQQALPLALQDVIHARLLELSEGSARLLEVLSVAGRPLEQGVALEVAGLAPSDRSAFQELRAARMVRTRGTRQSDFAEPYHDRVREAVVERIAPERAREIHALLARTSESWGVGEPEQLVVHYAEAGEGGRAGETAIQAARAAADKLAFDRAADLYRKAIELLPAADRERRRELQVQLGDALANAGRGAQSAEAYLAAVQLMPEAPARRLRRRAAQQLLASGNFMTGLAIARELLERAGFDYPSSPRRLLMAYGMTRSRLLLRGLEYTPRPVAQQSEHTAELLALLAALFPVISVYDTLGGALLHARFLLAALEAGDEVNILQGLAWECFHLSLRGGPRNQKRAQLVLGITKRLAARLGTPFAKATYQAALCAYLMFARGRYRDAFLAAASGEELLRAHAPGYLWNGSWLSSLKCIALEFADDFTTLLRETPQRERDAADRDDRFTLGMLLQSVPLAHMLRDEPERALGFVAQQAEKVGDKFSTLHFLLMLRTADVLLYQGRGRDALASVEARWDALKQASLFRSRLTRATAHLLRARCALCAYVEKRDERMLAIAIRDRLILLSMGKGYAGLSSAIGAQLALLRGDRASAQAGYESALREFATEQAENAGRYVRYRLGELLADAHGERMKNEAAQQLSRQGVVNPARWVAWMLPVASDFPAS